MRNCLIAGSLLLTAQSIFTLFVIFWIKFSISISSSFIAIIWELFVSIMVNQQCHICRTFCFKNPCLASLSCSLEMLLHFRKPPWSLCIAWQSHQLQAVTYHLKFLASSVKIWVHENKISWENQRIIHAHQWWLYLAHQLSNKKQ